MVRGSGIAVPPRHKRLSYPPRKGGVGLKNEWAYCLSASVALSACSLLADLTILAKLACALGRARAVPLAA